MATDAKAGVTTQVYEIYIKEGPFIPPIVQPHDLAGAEERLHEFLIGRFGGPPR